MGTRDKRVDAYIAKSADFAKPILSTLRETVHQGCPTVVEEMKWSSPHFNYKGMFCGMAAFNEHCIFGFWKGSLFLDPKDKAEDAMGHFGRITSLKELPPKKVLLGYIKKAMAVNDLGLTVPRKTASAAEKKALKVPLYFLSELRKNQKALAAFEGFSYSKKKDYVEWLSEAKSEQTRQRRLQTSVEWIAEGKSRNWKYERS